MKKLLAAAALGLAALGAPGLSTAPAQAAVVGFGVYVGTPYVQPVGYVTVRRVYRVRTCTVRYQRFYNGYRWVVKPVRVCSRYH